jgi:glycine cleavage system regulatory protein
MSISLVLTIIGSDRPGLVEALSRTVTDHGANWLESRMARMAGKFAGILRVEVEEAKAQALTAALRGLQSQGLTVVVESGAAAVASPVGEQRIAKLHFVGHDRPGIVKEISRAIAAKGINVDELVTECISAPMSGEPLFKATVTLRVPAGVKAAELSAELDRVAAALQLDLTLTD